jgi:small-conductance mechanosensitive channel
MSEIDRILARLWDWLNYGIAGSSFTVGKLMLVLVLLVALVWGTGRFTSMVVDRVLARRGLDVGIAQAVGTMFRYAVVGLGTLVIIQSSGIDLSALTVLAGALGVGLGFGLQNVTSNFISGLIILFERPIKVGDRVEVGQVMGDVRRIAARATTVVTNDNIAIIVPNSDFITQRVTNWSHGSRLVRLKIPVGVSYASDPEVVRRVLLEVAEHHQGVMGDPKPDVMFTEFGDSSLNFELRVWTRDFTDKPTVLRRQLNFDIWQKFKSTGIEIPFPQRDLHIRSGTLSVAQEPRPAT